jgi:hypothetical protein
VEDRESRGKGGGEEKEDDDEFFDAGGSAGAGTRLRIMVGRDGSSRRRILGRQPGSRFTSACPAVGALPGKWLFVHRRERSNHG